jgi:hypothetical protein
MNLTLQAICYVTPEIKSFKATFNIIMCALVNLRGSQDIASIRAANMGARSEGSWLFQL